MKYNTNPVRGTVDYTPSEMDTMDYAEKIIIDTYCENGFLHIKTPILENLDLLQSGDSGDNQKLMFKTVKRGEKLDLTKQGLTEKDICEEGLRYDLTVPLVRFFANNKEKLPLPFKAIQIGDAFRAERPQKGRVRQFTQCDIDILGEPSILGEIELLIAGARTYSKLGFKNLIFKINDRRILNEIIMGTGFEKEQVSDVCVSLDKADKIGMEKVSEELKENGFDSDKVDKLISTFAKLRDAKNNDESFELLKNAGISDEITTSLKTIIETVSKFTDESYKLVYDSSVVRGQGYYTGTVFEVFDADFGRAIGGGGRYDKMVGKFLGNDVPAVGFSIGFYSVVMLMNERNKVSVNNKLALIFDKNSDFNAILTSKMELIERGFDVSAFPFPKNFNNFVTRIKANGYNKIVKIQDIDKIIEI